MKVGKGKEPIKDQMVAKSKGSESRWICFCSLRLSDAHFLFISSPVKHSNFAAHDVKAAWRFAASELGYMELVHNNFSEYFLCKVLAYNWSILQYSKYWFWNLFIISWLLEDRIKNKTLNIHSKELEFLFDGKIFGLSGNLWPATEL